MSLLFRHVRNSVLRAPAQSAVLLLTVLLSALVFAFSFEVFSAVRGEQNFFDTGAARADILVTAADSRFIERAAAEEAAGAEASAGYFVLPAYDGEGIVSGAGIDLREADGIFEFAFTSYGEVTDATVGSVAFVTERFAASRSLSVGDSFTLRLLGTEKEYTVQGINRFALCGQFDVLVDAAGAVGVLASVSPVFALFDSENMPCSALYLRLPAGADLSAAEEAVRALPQYAGAEVSLLGEREEGTAFEDALMDIFMGALLIFVATVACVLVYFSLGILGEKRAEQTEAFLLAGMPRGAMFFALCAETAVYAALGTALGLAAAVPCLHLFGAAHFTYAFPRLTAGGAGLTFALEFVSAACALLAGRALSSKRGARKEGRPLAAAPSAAALAACVLCAFFLPVRAAYVAALGGLISLILLLLTGLPPLLRALGARSGRERGGLGFSLAAKNCARVLPLHSVARILSILLSVLVVLCACFAYCSEQVSVYERYFSCDYVVAGAGEGAAEEVLSLRGTEGVASLYCANALFEDGRSILLLSCSDPSYFSFEAPVPRGNELALPSSVAAMYGKEEGDEVTLTAAGQARTFTVTLYEGEGYSAFFDASRFGLRANVLLVRAAGGEAYLEALSEALALEGAVIGRPDALLRSQNFFVDLFVAAMQVFTYGTVAVALLGAVDLVCVSYARRRREFVCFRLAGMPGGALARMLACEGAILLGVVLLSAAAGGGLLVALLDCGMRSFGYSLWI